MDLRCAYILGFRKVIIKLKVAGTLIGLIYNPITIRPYRFSLIDDVGEFYPIDEKDDL